MISIDTLTEHLTQGVNLTEEEACSAARALASAEISVDSKRAFLVALTNKGETAQEVTAFARTFRELVRDPKLADFADRAIDIVGTGGSGSGGYNISSVSALIVAAGGVPVIKHGNRAVTSRSGSADFLGHLGVPLDPPLELLHGSIEALNFCFLPAPSFHPAFKEIIPVRKALAEQGLRSIFNILGPLINPARPAYQLLGVFRPQWVRPLADVLHALGMKRGMASCAELPDNIYMDELSCAGRNRVCGFGEFSGIEGIWSPRDLGLNECGIDDIRGGTPAENVDLFKEMVKGGGKRGLVDTISLNAGTALWIAGAADDVRLGTQQAKDILQGGTLANWLEKARDFYSSAPQKA